ncbi:TonB-dependent receptor [Emticicia sp. 21SJ11W-3]|uniref:TonB-dependent receptor n=1 Tax=Emticicia sp. 21SJ11W-3 TaxID=2916755 RepID=UPI00209E1253|nr:TonB-dependent receptor [Emticicia sp. 21SJ11W-3]UTA69120.1 TonB-dependent receptor [Emticicia sp. 21SJ11W-3]
MSFKFTILLLMVTAIASAQNKFTVSGYIREKGSQEQLIGVNVYLPNSSIATASNTYGFYSLTISASDSLTLIFSMVGYKRVEKQLSLLKNLELNIEMETANQLQEVMVSARRQQDKVSETPQMSSIDLPVQQIKKIPAFLGEKDVLKVLQLMPGVQKGSEGQSGIYVRGGGADQNLIILDDAIVYNANHLFGFFSTFNGDALKSVELTKGGFPARYGGRLSSVIDLNMKEGNKEKLHGEGGIGLISSRLTLEGPIRKGKSSFLISGRRTYLDVVARPFIKAQSDAGTQDDGGYYFYDLNAKLNYDFGRKDKVYASAYFGRDKFYSKSKTDTEKNDSDLNWGNITTTLRWNHLFNEKLFANTSFILSSYQFGIGSYYQDFQTSSDNYTLNYQSRINDIGLKSDFDYFPNPKHSARIGMAVTRHRFIPSAIVLKSSQTNLEREASPIDVMESGIYGEDTWKATDQLKMNIGLRLSYFIAQQKSYLRPEPRISAALKLAENLSAKASYAEMNQFVHLLSNTGIGLPTDLWVPTTRKVAPQNSRQVAAGIAKDFPKQNLALTVEGYYKYMRNILAYKEGSTFLNLDGLGAQEVNWENNVTAGNGWSYGGEFLLQRKSGRMSGWIGYTLSWTLWQFPELNAGKKFYPKYDRRHDLSLVGIYELTPRITISGTWVYGTGNALTLPVATYSAYIDRFNSARRTPAIVNRIQWSSQDANEYGEKNSYRAEPYHRLDFGIQFHKKLKHHERTWEFSLYNVYNRRNPFFYNISTETITYSDNTVAEKNVLKKYSLFPIVPAFSYNFKF